MKKKNIFLLIMGAVLLPTAAKAHCPLCTAGAGIAAVGAAYLGVSTAVIGVFIGAFGIAVGWWISKLLKKQYIRYQHLVVAVLSFLLTIIPLMPLMDGYTSWYVAFGGEYGNIFNRVYLINLFLLGSIVGGLLVLVAPLVSSKVRKLRKGKLFPYQGIIITFTLLAVTSLILELII
jgi:hypothetical protein